MSATTPVGTAKGPGEKPHEYVFISPDHDQAIKQGEYVYYEVPIDGQERHVIGRVVGRTPVRLLPDAFLSDPQVAPDAVADLIGYEGGGHEIFEVVVAIMGYFDQTLKTFVNPRIPPRSGWPIYLVPSEILARVLNRCTPGEQGSAHIGWLLSRPKGEVPIALAAKEFLSTHLAIIASTGSGKSYLAGVIIEELLKPTNKACMLIVDPHGEYETLDHIMARQEFWGGPNPSSYRPKVKVLHPDKVTIRHSALSLSDLHYLLEVPERQEFLLNEAYRKVSSGEKRNRWTFADLVEEITRIAEQRGERDKLDYSSSAAALGWRIDRLLHSSRSFHESRHLGLAEIFEPGQCTVLDLSEIDKREQQVIVSVLLRHLYEARVETEHGRSQDGDNKYLPYPAFVLLEEAHHFAPGGEGTSVVSSKILKQILAEGRKFGVGIGLISQRPGKLDADVLSQCMTQCIMRIVNPVDQANVASAVESVGRDLLDELPALSKGQVIVAGPSLNTPVLAQVRERLTPHGGQDIDAPREWDAYFSEQAVQRRQEEATFYQPQRPVDRMFRPTD
ncbi:MAG: ATP-binding protein [Chloroflexota bacterium]|nr:MAG: ATP-binding protein [Chloroflexota bacterium]